MKAAKPTWIEFAIAVAVLMLLPATEAKADTYYKRANALADAKEYSKALEISTEGLEYFLKRRDYYNAFYLARTNSHCHRDLGDLPACIDAAEEALGYLRELEQSGSTRMSERVRLFETVLLSGLMTKYHNSSHRLGLGRIWHERTEEVLLQLISLLGEPGYDIESGVVPSLTWDPVMAQIPRHLWMGGWILRHEARSAEAMEKFEAADRFLEALGPNLGRAESDYWFKIQNQKGLLLDHLGYLEKAIEIQRKIAATEITSNNARSIHLERTNLSRNLSQYYGPSEEYLADALVGFEALKEFQSPGDLMATRRMVNKMIFDLRDDPEAVADLAIVQEALEKSGFAMGADYTERDQIRIAIRQGTTAGLEKRLITLLERFRDQGNRSGAVELYRDYGNLCVDLERYHDAIFLYRQALLLSDQYGWHLHLPRLMVKLAMTHLKLGDIDSAHSWMAAMDAHLAKYPDIPPHRVAEAMGAWVDFYRRIGRLTDARKARDLLLAFIEEEDVPEYQVRGALNLDLEGGDVPAGSAAPVTQAPETDFEPRRVSSEVLPGEAAHARFTVANLSGSEIAGKLSFPLSFAVRSWEPDSGVLRLRADEPGKVASEGQHLMAVGPAEIVRIYLEAEVANAGAIEEIGLAWTVSEGESQASDWTYAGTDDQTELTVINANLIELNPFYFVPLYHAVRLRNLDSPIRDFRVRASVPCYIEMIDDATEEVLAVDRNGDGSFEEAGDLLLRNENRNLYPDYQFESTEDLFGVELRVFPTDLEKLADLEEISVVLESMIDGGWEVLAENRILLEQTD